jgi:hypothetical protein
LHLLQFRRQFIAALIEFGCITRLQLVHCRLMRLSGNSARIMSIPVGNLRVADKFYFCTSKFFHLTFYPSTLPFHPILRYPWCNSYIYKRIL